MAYGSIIGQIPYLGINATAVLQENVVAITSTQTYANLITFYAPSDFDENNTYTFNGTSITLQDLNNNPIIDGWKSGSPITFYIKGTEAFFKVGGGINDTLPPQVTNFMAVAGDAQVTLSWDAISAEYQQYLKQYVIVYKQNGIPIGVNDGTKVIVPNSETQTVITQLANDTLYGFRMFPANYKGQYQTEPTAQVTATPLAFQMPTYTGSHAVFGDNVKGYIEMYTSGTLTLNIGTYDIFAVGGGGAGGHGRYASQDAPGGGGGGSGYVTNKSGIKINETKAYTVTIGAGGRLGFSYDDESISAITAGASMIVDLIDPANPGLNGKNAVAQVTGSYMGGGDGGSGGGTGMGSKNYSDGRNNGGNGGSNGSNGLGRGGGTGAGVDTHAFGDSSFKLYAGGGGGGGGYDASYIGGEGGGGNGAYATKQSAPREAVMATDGTANTGGGGGGGLRLSSLYGKRFQQGATGGSGIVIMRWGY